MKPVPWAPHVLMVDAGRPASGADSRVSQWVFDACPGQISALNGSGRLLMAIPASPLFGPRLAAAFSSPATGPATAAESRGDVGIHHPHLLRAAAGPAPDDRSLAAVRWHR